MSTRETGPGFVLFILHGEPPMAAVLLSAVHPPADLRQRLAGADFQVIDHLLGSVPPVDFGGLAAALVEVGNRAESAVTQTRRWRAELADEPFPIIWLLPGPDPDLIARGLESGATAVLVRPVEPAVLLAQVRSAVRARATAARLAARAAESRLLGERLKKAHAEANRTAAALRRVRLAVLERSFPDYGPIRVAVSHCPRGRMGGDFYEVVRAGTDRIAVVVGDVIGAGAATDVIGHLASRIAGRLVCRSDAIAGEVLAQVNRELLALNLDDAPLVAMVIATVTPSTGELALARAGLPAPLFLPADCPAARWSIPGPFLGTCEASFATHKAILRTGERLMVGSDGIRPDGNPEPTAADSLLERAEEHRSLTGQLFVDSVARDLLAAVQHDDDFTLVVIESAP